jgi:hypothetical protein
MQLRRFIPSYVKALAALNERHPSSHKLSALYHNDVVSRYLCRILNIFASRKTALLDRDYLSWVYGLMDEDKALGVLSIRIGQVFNVLLYKLGRIRLSIMVYRFTSMIFSWFNA